MASYKQKPERKMAIDNNDILRMLKSPELRNDGFDALIHAYTQRLYWHIRRMVVVHDDAADLLQETWIKVFDGMDSFRGGGEELTAWLYRIATNNCLGMLRHKYRRPMMFFDDPNSRLLEKFAETESESAESMEHKFQQALLSLPTKQRTVFNLRYYDELSYSEISRITGMSEATLKTNYHYAQKRIKELMTR